jgi:hypothetical protein
MSLNYLQQISGFHLLLNEVKEISKESKFYLTSMLPETWNLAIAFTNDINFLIRLGSPKIGELQSIGVETNGHHYAFAKRLTVFELVVMNYNQNMVNSIKSDDQLYFKEEYVVARRELDDYKNIHKTISQNINELLGRKMEIDIDFFQTQLPTYLNNFFPTLFK